jgi:hypothetical protein
LADHFFVIKLLLQGWPGEGDGPGELVGYI